MPRKKRHGQRGFVVFEQAEKQIISAYFFLKSIIYDLIAFLFYNSVSFIKSL